jgi:hypothetical protein
MPTFDPQNTVIAGEIVEVLRGSGIYASGDSIKAKTVSVGLMTPETFMANIGGMGTGNVPEFSGVAGMTLDGLFSPYSSATQHSTLPHFGEPTSTSGPTAKTLNPWNPNNSLPTGDNSAEWMVSGHNITLGVVGSSIGATGDPTDFAFEKDFFERQRVEASGNRGIALRSPLVVAGWGFNTAGKPVPAATGNANEFHPSGMIDPSLWKAGPVDLRWNDDRKVWSAGGGAEVMKFTINDTNSNLGQNGTACDHVTVTVNEIGCSTNSVTEGQTGVLVYDDDLCFFNLPYSVIIGMKGTAHKMVNPYADSDPESEVDCVALGYVQGACRWVVTGLCCGEEISAP